jgi:hypothetical protein
MEITPGYAEPYPPAPPPPPPQRSRTGLWIGLAIGLIVLCLCCLVIAVAAYLNWAKISNFFYTRTAQSYSNADAGISLYYPNTWQYSESGDASSGYYLSFASSPDFLNNPSTFPTTGAIMVIMTGLNPADLTSTVDTSSMGNVVTYLGSNISTDVSPVQNLRSFTLSGFPAASGIYTGTIDTTSTNISTVYIIATSRNNEIVVMYGLCSQAEWSQYKPTFDSILNSVSLVAP